MNGNKSRVNNSSGHHRRRYSHNLEDRPVARINIMLITCCFIGAAMWYGIYLIVCEI